MSWLLIMIAPLASSQVLVLCCFLQQVSSSEQKTKHRERNLQQQREIEAWKREVAEMQAQLSQQQ